MATMTYREAVRTALREALQSDPRVFLMGEDVGRYGGAFACSKGLLDEFGQERVRDTPLSESTFVGAGIGAALGGLRPIVEVMTVNFSLLAMDQIVNNAAILRHMSGGRRVAAQHSNSWEGWYARVPGLKVLALATVHDARFMLRSALQDPDPVLIFEHIMLYPVQGEVDEQVGPVDMHKAIVRRQGTDVTLIAWSGSLGKTLQAAETLASDGYQAEVIDLRCLRPLDMPTILASVAKTHRAVVIDEAWRTGSFAAEISAQIMENAFYELDAPVGRVCSSEVPIPYAGHLEDAALPKVDAIVRTARELVSARSS